MSSSGEQVLLSTNTATKSFQVMGPARISLKGNFGGGTAQVRAKGPDGVFNALSNGSFTAESDTIFDFPARSETELDVELTGATAPAIKVWVQAAAPHH